MGNPDGATPKHIVDKMIEAAGKTATHRYSLSKGIPRLRKAICNWYQQRYDVELDPQTEAIVTIGSKEGIAHLCLATLDRGDVVAVPSPSYPIHIYGPVIAGANVRGIPVHSTDDFLAELEQTVPLMYPRPKMLILNFPANPTTQCVDLAFFERVVALCKEFQIYLVHDLAYADLGLRWISRAIDPAGAGSERYRCRVLHLVQELQHAWLASRLHGGQS
jgi:alanine-synthesizing transaminase